MNRKINKRESERQCCLVPVEGRRGSTFSDLQAVDINSGGIGLTSGKAIPLSQKIAVQIEIKPEEEPIVVLGQVVWVRKLLNSQRYRVGLKFKKTVFKTEQARLDRHLGIE